MGEGEYTEIGKMEDKEKERERGPRRDETYAIRVQEELSREAER